jgi:pimeloyl-ACP methyl ester carboxylesterase
MLLAVDGGVLDVVVSGPPDGAVLLYHHGTPGAVTPPPHVRSAAHARGLRLVTYSRPGYGSSTRRPGRRVADVEGDVTAVLDHLQASRCLVTGWSGGGPHALATAALLPDRVGAVLLMAGVAPWDAPGLSWLAGMGEDNVHEFGAAQRGEAELRAFLEAQVPALTAGTVQDVLEEMRSLVPPVDQAALTDEFAAFLLASMQEGLRTGVDGWVDDDLAFLEPWGIDLSAPARHGIPVFVWQGTEDLMVPAAHGQWLAEHVAGATGHVEAGQGHMSIVVGAIERMLDELAAHR